MSQNLGQTALAFLVAIQNQDLHSLQGLIAHAGNDPDLDSQLLWRRVRQFLQPADESWLNSIKATLRPD